MDYIRCVAFKHTAAFVHRYFTKGRKIALQGRLRMCFWTDNAGEKHCSTEAVVDRAVHLVKCEFTTLPRSFADRKPQDASAPDVSPPPTSAYYREPDVVPVDDSDLPF